MFKSIKLDNWTTAKQNFIEVACFLFYKIKVLINLGCIIMHLQKVALVTTLASHSVHWKCVQHLEHISLCRISRVCLFFILKNPLMFEQAQPPNVKAILPLLYSTEEGVMWVLAHIPTSPLLLKLECKQHPPLIGGCEVGPGSHPTLPSTVEDGIQAALSSTVR